MDKDIKRGLSFGLTSGVITTLGLMVGLDSSTGSKIAVIGGIISIAIADSLSDALGMHNSEESQHKSSARNIWEATIATFIAKLVFALSFLVPILMFELGTAMVINLVWGALLISLFSYFIAKERKESPVRAILEHLTMATAVIIVTYIIGMFVATIL